MVLPDAAREVVETELRIGTSRVDFTGRSVEALTVNGAIPGPTLEFREGDVARIHVHNELDVGSSIHWHGLLLPPEQDGVPAVVRFWAEKSARHSAGEPGFSGGLENADDLGGNVARDRAAGERASGIDAEMGCPTGGWGRVVTTRSLVGTPHGPGATVTPAT